jgi:hypothetical protein
VLLQDGANTNNIITVLPRDATDNAVRERLLSQTGELNLRACVSEHQLCVAITESTNRCYTQFDQAVHSRAQGIVTHFRVCSCKMIPLHCTVVFAAASSHACNT